MALGLEGPVQCRHVALAEAEHAERPPTTDILIDVPLTDPSVLTRLGEVLPQSLGPRRRRIILVDRADRTQYLIAAKLGATNIIPRPATRTALLHALFGDRVPHRPTILPTLPDATVKAFESSSDMFRELLLRPSCDAGTRAMVEAASHDAMAAIEQSGLSTWIEAVRRHHNATFRHCLIVNGLAVAFAQGLGFSHRDILTLSVASAVHDVGKARTPLAILDKPGPLNDREMAILERHPVDGVAMLRATNEFDAAILDAVLHHHEFLDGSGYPEGLRGSAIPDLTRLVTIVDIFAALVEERAYKAPMSPTLAFEHLLAMDAKLERSLVHAFRPIADAYAYAGTA